MYLDYFELKEAPFSITPDPRFVYLTAQHRDALAHLLFGINQGGGGGFVQLTGEVGTGKTTLCRLLMAQVPETVRIALILNPMQQPIELLRTICDELRIVLPKRSASIKVLTDALTRYLLESYAAGLRVVLIIDEAQNLSFEALEQIRLLTNLETPTQKLLQIILLGQPELRDLLAREELRQLAQRITARFHLAPLTSDDTAAYVEHRLAVAGRHKPLFNRDAMRELHRLTQGYPRAINVVADRALLGAYARTQDLVDTKMVRAAAQEVAGHRAKAGSRFRVALMAAVVVLFLTILAFRSHWTTVPLIQSEAAPVATTPSPELRAFAAFEDAAAAANVVAGWWDAPAFGDEADCSQWRAGRALCARLRLNATMLRELDRPLALVLRRQGVPRWLSMRRLGPEAAQVAGPQRLAERPWAEIESEWLGDALLVTEAPLGYDGIVLGVGAVGALVERVHAALHGFDGRDAKAPGRYDADTAERVRQLQAHYGLRPDGVVGPETLALLVALGTEGPRLTDRIDEKAFVSAPQQ
jgi:general secretion pathway protein A